VAAKGVAIVVDAMNVIGSRPTGWWRDRDGAVRALAARLSSLAAAGERAITLVVDGREIAGLAPGPHDGVEVLYASRRGPNAADDRIVEYVGGHADPTSLTVVTSDRVLAARVRSLGAGVEGAMWLLGELDAGGA